MSRNLAALAVANPETARWLSRFLPAAGPCNHSQGACDSQPDWRGHHPRPEGVTVVVGAGLLDGLCSLLTSMPEGHQVFLVEPRPQLLLCALGCFDLAHWLRYEDLVVLAPGETRLVEALHRYPQLALAEQVEMIQASLPPAGTPEAAQVSHLFRVLGQARLATAMSLKWEEPLCVNLVLNLSHAVFMGRAGDLVACLAGRPAVLAEAGPSLEPFLKKYRGRLHKAAFFCSQAALPAVLEAGILPSATVFTNPGPGPRVSLEHPCLDRVPLVAEEVAHAETVRSHPGPRFICLGARITDLGPLNCLSQLFTPQHHELARMAELALACGCSPLILAGADLTDDQGPLTMTSLQGEEVHTQLAFAAAARDLGEVLSLHRVPALNASFQGLHLPGTQPVSLDRLDTLLAHEGQPLRIAALEREAWLGYRQMDALAREQRRAAARATRFWQRAALPASDLAGHGGLLQHQWLGAAEALYQALADQALADPLLATSLEGCLMRAFRRRHRLACQARGRKVRLEDACRQLGLCLTEMELRAGELAQGLSEVALFLDELADAQRRGDVAFMTEFALRTGHQAMVPA